MGMGRKIAREDILRDWPAGEYLYKDPDYVPGRIQPKPAT
jgi:hypothetical protein